MRSNTAPALPARKAVDRKVYILIVLVGLTALVIYYQATSGPPAVRISSNPPAQKRIQPQQRNPGASRQTQPSDPLQSEDPDFLPQLKKEPPPFENERRNLFTFYVPPPPPPPPPPQPVCGDGTCNGAETHDTCPSDCLPPPPPPVCGNSQCEAGESYINCPSDCDPPPPPEISLKYIGYLKDDAGPVSFLTDGQEVFMGRVDDIIANRYRVIKITEDGVELGYVNLRTGQSKTIPFEKGKSN